MARPIQRWLAANRALFDLLDSRPWYRAGFRAHVHDAITLEPIGHERAHSNAGPISDFIRSGARHLVLGEVGSGKTLLARGLARQLSQPGSHLVPVYVEAQELLVSGLHPFDLAERQLARLVGSRDSAGLADALHELAERGGICLVVDGLEFLRSEQILPMQKLISAWLEEPIGSTVFAFGRPRCDDWVDHRLARLRTLSLDVSEQTKLALFRRWIQGGQAVSENERDSSGEPEVGVELPWFHADLDSPLLIGALAVQSGVGSPPARHAVYGAALKHLLHRAGEARALVAERAIERLLTDDSSTVEPREFTRRQATSALGSDQEPSLSDVCFVTDTWRMLTQDLGLLTTDDDPSSDDSVWRWVHPALYARLSAERLANGGSTAIAERAHRARRADETRGLGQVLGMACSLTSDPIEALAVLAKADARLAVEALPEVTPLAAHDAVTFLLDLQETSVGEGWKTRDIWNGDTLLMLSGVYDDFVDALWERVTANLSIAQAAFFYYALSRLESGPVRARFFAPDGFCLSGNVKTPFKAIEPGVTTVGSSSAEVERFFEDDPLWLGLNLQRELPTRLETRRRSFAVAATPTTWADYRAFDPDHPRIGHDAEPVSGVSWWSAHLFAAWCGSRLPTEAEWEYACRAGTTTAYSFGDDPSDLNRYAVYGEPDRGRPERVAGREPNRWGLYDMHGNVWEWTDDAWQVRPGQSPVMRQYRVARGGSFAEEPEWVRSASRTKSVPASTWHQVGFRLVRDI